MIGNSDLVSRIYLATFSHWTRWLETTSNKKGELACSILVVLIAMLVLLWYKWTCMGSRNGVSSLPPGPRGLPILGYLPFLGENLHENFTELAHRYGPIYKLRLGSKLYLVINSHTLAKVALRDQDTIFGNRDPPIAALAVTYGGLDIAWSDIDTYWRNIRKIFVREVLSNANLDACYAFRIDEVRKTIKNLFTRVGSRVNINEVSFSTELNVVSNMLWGSTLNEGAKNNDLGAEFQSVVSKIVELLGKPNISDFLPFVARFDIQGVEREMKRQAEHVDRIFDSIIEGGIRSNSFMKDGRKDFLQICLGLKEQEDASLRLNVTQIKSILMDIIVGGTDTTAAMTEWAMTEIIRNPEIMKKVQDELSQVVGTDSMVEESHLPKLQYLDGVVRETFRLHPALPLLTPRCLTQSSTIAGYNIPKGTRVFINAWAIHRDPRNWENPSEFKPERFLGDNAKKFTNVGNDFNYMPFGSGRRVCAGIPLAEKMLMLMIASLLHAFDWSLPEGEETIDTSEKFGIVMKKRIPLVAIPSQRLLNVYLYL